MAYTVIPTVVTGQTYTAANYNTYIKANIAELFPFTTAGDTIYASGSASLSRLALDTQGKVYAAGASTPGYVWTPSGINIFIGNGLEEILTGVQFSPIVFPFGFVIQSYQVLAKSGDTGDIVLDLWVDTYANYPATVADTITASAKPTISSGSKTTDSTLSGWTTSIAKGSHMIVNVDSVTDITQATLAILGYKIVV